MFLITRQGLDFFATFFDYPYAFGKYDQVFVPEFNSGAMENVAAVTHNEMMIYRDPPTDNQKRRRAEVILHEMAHMWFGDLVTMRWWNDLWLNESFATYMSYLCMTQATRFTGSWQDFNASIKNWAYRQDQLITTHPIAGQVADTEQTFLNFDGITYGKGASVLKQLAATIGADGFREGMRHYFRTHAFGNATLAQFLASLEAGSNTDLKEWSKAWLETPSLNTISASWEADGERITKLSVAQVAPAEYPTIRPHQMEVGLLREEAGRIEVTSLPMTLTGAEAELNAARGLPKPDLVFPNYNDHDYAKVALDNESVAFVRASLDRIDDILLRQQLWSSLFTMVRDQQLKSTDFLALVIAKLPLERDLSLADAVLGQALAVLARYVPEATREREAHLFFCGALEALRTAPAGDAKIVWGRAVVNSAVARDDIETTGRLSDGAETVPGFTVDQDMRWTIAAKYVANGLAGAAARVNAETARDPSDRGQRALLRARVSQPSADVKAAAWERFRGEGYGSFHLTRAAMEGFIWNCQRDLLEPYVEKFFETVTAVFQGDNISFAEDYFLTLFPGYRVERTVLERSERLLAATPESMAALRRVIREANDDLQRAIRCREYAAS
jgi:aminopeptidase N